MLILPVKVQTELPSPELGETLAVSNCNNFLGMTKYACIFA